jgi:hypothetical protein
VIAALRLLGRPALDPVAVDPRTEARFAAAADELASGAATIPEPRLDFLRWLASNRAVVFHGSPRADLVELSTERASRDATMWGNQRAVYATRDPVWAIYFACLNRGGAFTGTRNGTIGSAGGPLYPRVYFFAHNRGSATPDRFGPGSLYVLPGDTFETDRPHLGLDTAHLVSRVPVAPLARIDVTPDAFPFRHRIGYFRRREPPLFSLLRG